MVFRAADSDGSPLYRRIADQLAYRIATGRLRPGLVLPSLRRAQAAWGVHLHTVRRAYHELEHRGFVRMRRGGPPVVLASVRSSRPSLRESLVAFLSEAASDHGATPAMILEEIRQIVEDWPRVVVVECSRTLARSIGDQLAAEWHVTARPALLTEHWTEEDVVVSTPFHRLDLINARSGASRTPAVSCVRLRLGRRFLREAARRLRGVPAQRVAICETDAAFGAHVAAELRAHLQPGVEVRVHAPIDVARFLDVAERGALKLLSPRNWDRLADHWRADREVMLLEYEVDPSDLEELGRRLGWRRAGEGMPT